MKRRFWSLMYWLCCVAGWVSLSNLLKRGRPPFITIEELGKRWNRQPRWLNRRINKYETWVDNRLRQWTRRCVLELSALNWSRRVPRRTTEADVQALYDAAVFKEMGRVELPTHDYMFSHAELPPGISQADLDVARRTWSERAPHAN